MLSSSKSSAPPPIKSFDLFGITPHLYFQGHDKKGSCFGVCLSFMLLSFTIICFFYFGQTLYYRKDPIVAASNSFATFPEKFIIDPTQFPLLFEINDRNGVIYYTDHRMLRATVSQLTFTRVNGTQILTTQTYDMEICNISHFEGLQNDLKGYFDSKQLSNYFCLPKYLKNLTVQGSFDQDLYQNVKLSFTLCNNDMGCLPRNEILGNLTVGYVGLYFVDTSFDSANFDSPWKYAPHEFSTNFVAVSQRSINIFFKNSYVNSDDGVVFSKNRRQKFVGSDGFQEYDFLSQKDEFFMIYFRMRQEIEDYSRIYSKLQELLAQIGGFINMFWIFSKIINLLYARLLYIRDIVLNVFSVKSSEFNSELEPPPAIPIPRKSSIVKKNIEIFAFQDRGNQKIVKIPQKNINENDDNTVIDVHYSQENLSKMKKPMDKTIKEVSLNFLDYIHYYTGWFKSPEREKKKAILSKGELILKKNLDVKYIIEKFYEIEKLKYFLLTEEQLTKFHQLERPELVLLRRENERRSMVITKVLRKRVSVLEATLEPDMSPSARTKSGNGKFFNSSFVKYSVKK